VDTNHTIYYQLAYYNLINRLLAYIGLCKDSMRESQQISDTGTGTKIDLTAMAEF